jgi:predicted kinase
MSELFVLIGLPAAGKTTRARQLAAQERALRMTPDEWMVTLFGEPEVGDKRDIVEARLLRMAWDTLRLDTNVVLDFGFWSRDERSAMRWLARSAGATCRLVYLPVDHDTQLARIAHRQATAAHTTFPIAEADLAAWRAAFEEPDDAELAEDAVEGPPPPGSISWWEWTAQRWPTFAGGPVAMGKGPGWA